MNRIALQAEARDSAGIVSEKVTKVTFGDPPVAETREIYTYNDLDMLTSETKLDSTNGVIYQKSYQYDLAGNRTNTVFDGVTNIYTFGTGNKLSTWGTNGSMQYADAGNVTNITYQDGRSLGIAWNDRYEITSISTNGALAESHEYDALGRRVSISDGTTTNYLIYDGIHVIAEVGTSSSLVRSYTYGPGTDNILAMTDHTGATNTYYFLKDHLGSVIAVTDETGTNIVERYEYDAWGNVLGVYDSTGGVLQASQIGNRYLWQGREYSWNTGLYYFRARWYDPVTGRWLSKDPIGISGGLNQYVFVGNNPVNSRDPLGLCENGEQYINDYIFDLRDDAWRVILGPEAMLQWSYRHELKWDLNLWEWRGQQPLRGDVMGNVGAGYALSEVYGPAIASLMFVVAEIELWNGWEDAKGSWSANLQGQWQWAKDHPMAAAGNLLSPVLFWLQSSTESVADMIYGGSDIHR